MDLQPNLPDLTVRGLAAEVRHQWRENPLARRVWKRIRIWVLVFALVQALQQGIAILSQVIGATWGQGGLSVSTVAIVGSSCFFGLLQFAVWIMAPVWYAKWVLRKYWHDDPNMGTAPFSRRDLFMGMAVPALLGIVVFYLPSLLAVPATMVLTFSDPQMAAMMGGGGMMTSVSLSVSGFSQTVVSVWTYAILFPTVMLRVMLLDSVTGQVNGRTWWWVVRAFAANLGLTIVWSMVRYLPMMAIIMGSTFAMSMGGGGASWTGGGTWAFIGVFSVLLDVLGALLFVRVFKVFWKRDIPLARDVLFRAGE